MVCAFLFSFLALGGWRLVLFGVRAPRAGLRGGGVSACASAYGECESGAVCAGPVVASQAREGGRVCVVAVYHDENGVHFVSAYVVVVSAVFDVGVHDAGGVVSAIVGVFEMMPAVHASHGLRCLRW